MWKVPLQNKMQPSSSDNSLTCEEKRMCQEPGEKFTSWYWNWESAARSTLWCHSLGLIKCIKHTAKWIAPITTSLWTPNSNWQYSLKETSLRKILTSTKMFFNKEVHLLRHFWWMHKKTATVFTFMSDRHLCWGLNRLNVFYYYFLFSICW